MSKTISVSLAEELSNSVARFAAEHDLPFETAMAQLLFRGLRTLPGGCFCGRTWHERREARAQAARPAAAEGDPSA